MIVFSGANVILLKAVDSIKKMFLSFTISLFAAILICRALKKIRMMA